MRHVRSLIVRMAEDNTSSGYARIQGTLEHVGYKVARSTVAKVLREHGIKPAPDRPTSWRSFLQAHADVLVAADFFTTEVWTARGLVTHYTLFVIDLASRAVHIAGTTPNPDWRVMAQIARNSPMPSTASYSASATCSSIATVLRRTDWSTHATIVETGTQEAPAHDLTELSQEVSASFTGSRWRPARPQTSVVGELRNSEMPETPLCGRRAWV
jgi:hypothetical protein